MIIALDFLNQALEAVLSSEVFTAVTNILSLFLDISNLSIIFVVGRWWFHHVICVNDIILKFV